MEKHFCEYNDTCLKPVAYVVDNEENNILTCRMHLARVVDKLLSGRLNPIVRKFG